MKEKGKESVNANVKGSVNENGRENVNAKGNANVSMNGKEKGEFAYLCVVVCSHSDIEEDFIREAQSLSLFKI